MMAAGVVVAILHALMAMGLFGLDGFEDVSDFLTNHPIWSPVYTAYLAFVWIYFFVFFWTRAGQTLGMRAWKLHMRSNDGSSGDGDSGVDSHWYFGFWPSEFDCTNRP